MSKLYVATVAMDPVWADKGKNSELTRQHVRRVLELYPQTQIILFPEMSLTGYILDDRNQEMAEPLNGPTVQAVQEIAQEYKVSIVASMIGQGEPKPANTTFVIDADGKFLASYNKNHLYMESAEPKLYSPGTTLATFSVSDWKCGLSTCFDIRYPRLFEAYRKSGVDCMFSPFNWVQGRNKAGLFDCLIKARAHENQFFFVAVDRKGSDPNASYHGLSLVVNPYGEDIAQREDDLYAFAELDKAEILKLRSALPLRESFKEKYRVC
ncbi:MAG: carbon-nitrogen hydrolase family protein [Bdellovibrionales bacterium]